MKAKLGRAYWKLWSATAISNLGDGVSGVAYPWLASAVTRSPLLIAAAGFASRLPWLVFTLHAGVITDRFDRRKLILAMDLFRGILTVFVGVVVLLNGDSLPSLNELSAITDMETNNKWKFVYLGANQDSFEVGNSIGIRTSGDYDYSELGCRNIMRSVSECVSKCVSQEVPIDKFELNIPTLKREENPFLPPMSSLRRTDSC